MNFPAPVDLDDLLNPFQRFGVNLGLDRIRGLLNRLGNPQKQVPIVHVAGSNGKGSVCAYLAEVLQEAGYRVGCSTSPHLVSWCERIRLQGQFITPRNLRRVLEETIAALDPEQPSPTLFEIFTAATWLYFAQESVNVAVMEVGLGGRLDATNVTDQTLAAVITSISREHWQVLGNTLGQIATEKAGILKPHCPAIVGPLPPEAEAVVAARAAALQCPVTWVSPAKPIATEQSLDFALQHLKWQDRSYSIQLQGEVQQINSALAIATLECLQQQGWHIPDTAIQRGMAQATWAGRLQWTTWNDRPLLLDGAHNPGAALALRTYLDQAAFRQSEEPITWVMGMLRTKDHDEIFQALLRPNDRLHLVPVPGHSSAEPGALANLARSRTALAQCEVYRDLFEALNTVCSQQTEKEGGNSEICTVLCGSLYLLGYFFHQPYQ